MISKNFRTWLLAFTTALISVTTPFLFGEAIVLTSCTTEEESLVMIFDLPFSFFSLIINNNCIFVVDKSVLLYKKIE